MHQAQILLSRLEKLGPVLMFSVPKGEDGWVSDITYAFHGAHFQLCIFFGISFVLGWSWFIVLYVSESSVVQKNRILHREIGAFVPNLYFNYPISLPVFTEYQGSHRKTHFTFRWLDGRNFWPWKVEMVLLWKLIILLPFMSCSTGKMFHY